MKGRPRCRKHHKRDNSTDGNGFRKKMQMNRYKVDSEKVKMNKHVLYGRLESFRVRDNSMDRIDCKMSFESFGNPQR